jgi:uncharacterized protein YkwD
VLPALTAVLAGALVAGAVTFVANAPAQSAADEPNLSIGLTDDQAPDGRGDLERPGPESDTPGDPTGPSGTEDTSSDTPPTSTTTPPASTPAPPPVTTTETSEEPPPPPPATPDLSRQDQVVSLVNTFRGEAGCGPVSVDDRLTASAQGHASDMSNRDYFSHTTPDGVTFDRRIRNAGYPSPGAENIARGARTASDVMRMWMESDGHRRNILNCDLNVIGVGLDTDGFYWVQNFGY